MSNPSHKPYRSFFWPVILLGAGVIWLLTNLGIIPTENLWILVQLWPVLLIIIGLDVIFARRLPVVGALLALVAIGGIIFILLEGGSLPLAEKPQPRTETFVVSAEDTETATVELHLTTQPAFINTLAESNNLLQAEIGHFGNVEMTVTGGEEKQVVLEQTGLVSWLVWLFPDAREELIWDIGLNPEVTMDLDVHASTGRAEMDLRGLQMGRFRFDASTGAARIELPASQQAYVALVEASTGGLEIILPEDGNLTLQIDGSTGQITLDVPEGAALRVEVQRGGTGDVIRPDWLVKIEGSDDRDEGVYETRGFDAAEYQLVVIVEDLSTGNLVIE